MENNIIKKDFLYFGLALLIVIPMLNMPFNIENLLLTITYIALIIDTYIKIKDNKNNKIPFINIGISVIGITFIFTTFLYYLFCL